MKSTRAGELGKAVGLGIISIAVSVVPLGFLVGTPTTLMALGHLKNAIWPPTTQEHKAEEAHHATHEEGEHTEEH